MIILSKILKFIGKVIAVLLILLILIPLIFVAIPYKGTAKDVEPIGDITIDTSIDNTKSEDSYPFIFVHGMMGWGENAPMQEKMPYWGLSHDTDLIDYLRANDYDVYAPSVSPVGSAYDRACELYAQLTGTRVDYGEAHSREYGHERYGRDYSGKATMGEPWDLKTKINLVGHSFGGPTIRVLTSLLAYGSTAEVEASGDNCSELFRGGHADAIHAVVTLASPSNGAPLANIMNDTYLSFVFTSVMNKLYDPDNAYDPMIDQWGVTEKIDLLNDLKLSASKDHCGYDMTINGASVLNKKFPTVPNVYYISCSASLEGGNNKFLTPAEKLTKALTHIVIDGKVLGKEWEANDGLVPVISARYPDTDLNNFVDYKDGMHVDKGIWVCMPTDMSVSHGYYCSPAGEVTNFYTSAKDMIDFVNYLD